MYRINTQDKTIARRQRVERSIVRRVVTDALVAGFVLDVYDGGEAPAARGVTKVRQAMLALLNTDEDYLMLRRADSNEGRGWVHFVYGNDGWDVINDYSISIEPALAGAEALANRLEEGKR
jgi:hypothetical protein